MEPANWKAERGILPLQSDRFDVVVLRPHDLRQRAKGNYLRLSRLAECPEFRSLITVAVCFTLTTYANLCV